MLNHESIKTALHNYKNWKIPLERDYITSLPLINLWRRTQLPGKQIKKKMFADYDVLFMQHHLGPFLGRLNQMFEEGLNPGNCWFVDIPYSTCNYVWKTIQEQCPPEQTAKPMNNPLAIYSETQINRVSEIVLKICDKSPKNLLVVDDGAYFLRSLFELRTQDTDIIHRFGKGKNQINLGLVEQTTRGHRHLHDYHLKQILSEIECSTVSIARCFTKINLENIFIGESVAKSINNKLDSISENKKEKLKAKGGKARFAILGFGPIGKSTTQSLLEHFENASIDIIDPDLSKHSLIKELYSDRVSPHEHLPSPHKNPGTYDMVIGCTGYGSFMLHHRHLLNDGAYLVSASSAAIEFNRKDFIERSKFSNSTGLKIIIPASITKNMKCQKTVNRKIHTDIVFQETGIHSERKGKSCFTFTNAGFPINFTGDIESLPPPLIQPTHCLLFAASCQVVGMMKNKLSKLVELNKEDDMWIFIEGVNDLTNPELWRK